VTDIVGRLFFFCGGGTVSGRLCIVVVGVVVVGQGKRGTLMHHGRAVAEGEDSTQQTHKELPTYHLSSRGGVVAFIYPFEVFRSHSSACVYFVWRDDRDRE